MIFHFPEFDGATLTQVAYFGSNIKGLRKKDKKPLYVTIDAKEIENYGIDKAWKYMATHVLPALKEPHPKYVFISAAAGDL